MIECQLSYHQLCYYVSLFYLLRFSVYRLLLSLCPYHYERKHWCGTWHLERSTALAIPPYVHSSSSHFTDPQRRMRSGAISPLRQRTETLGLSALNGPTVSQPPCRLSPQTVWQVWSPDPCVRRQYSELSAPKSGLFKGTSHTEMVFGKRIVYATFWQAYGVFQHVNQERSFSIHTINLW